MKKKSPLAIIFVTVFLDLVGFGIVIPLVGVYGKHYGASAFELGVLGAIYSLMQFFFAPFWGNLSDKIGRRPVLLISMAGSTLSYFGFALAESFWFLVVTRAMAGVFAANISAAQAYIADVTTKQDRAKGMGLIGAAFGIGFTLGPALGGVAAAKIGLSAPGWIAGGICLLNLLTAVFRLPESLTPEVRARAAAESKSKRGYAPLSLSRLREAITRPGLGLLLLTSFMVTFAFSNVEQTFSLFMQEHFRLDTGNAGYKTGIMLMWAGLLGAIIQGGLIRRLVPRFGEARLLRLGLAIGVIAMGIFPYGPTYASYFLIIAPLAVANGLINPSLYSLISKSASSGEQGMVLGLSQGLGSLARAFGPMCGMLLFDVGAHWPFILAAGCYLAMVLVHRTRIPNERV